MLTDAILREATAEAERFLLSIVPEEDGEPHVFSKRFERKMEKLIRRVNHPIRYQVMRAAAAIVLVAAMLFGAVVAVSPEARAAVVGWIRETFGVYTHYSNDSAHTNNSTDSNDDAKEPAKYEYHLAKIPTGYQELTVFEDPFGKNYVYVNDSGQILQFSCSYNTSDSVFIETENYEKYSDFVHECPADIYISPNENETSIIVWHDIETGALLRVAAMANQAELIEIAETVEKNKQ